MRIGEAFADADLLADAFQKEYVMQSPCVDEVGPDIPKDSRVPLVASTRYVTPLREGGSLPAVVEADDGQLYVMKFRGAGQGAKALIAELVAGEIARALGLPVPEIAFIHLNGQLGRSEPDMEIQDLLKQSTGINLGLRYLPSAFAYNQLLRPVPDAALASAVVWFDAYVTNVDRTARNVNLLMWRNAMWLIDHGAALYFHHDWARYMERSKSAFPLIHQHVLLEYASALDDADQMAHEKLSENGLREIIRMIPGSWLGDEPEFTTCGEHRQAYVDYLLSRLEASSVFVEEAKDARSKLV
jgi:hypothetical protein